MLYVCQLHTGCAVFMYSRLVKSSLRLVKVCLGERSVYTREESVFCCRLEYPVYVCQVQLILVLFSW